MKINLKYKLLVGIFIFIMLVIICIQIIIKNDKKSASLNYLFAAFDTTVQKNDSDLIFYDKDFNEIYKKNIPIGGISDSFIPPLEFDEKIYVAPNGNWFETDCDEVLEFNKKTGNYISYKTNENYWKGAPKIAKLNIKIVSGSQLYAGLQSGEIDITQPTMSVIPEEDYDSVEALSNVNVVYGEPVTNQSVFIQTKNVPDVRVRQAMLYAIDRKMVLEQLLKGKGEVADGFLSSASPFYDDSIVPVEQDVEKAKELLAEAGWDGSQTLRFYVNSGDSAFVNAANVFVAQWAAVGIKVEVQTVDFATLMSVAGTNDYDILAVQYTYAPVDPYPDVAWLLGGEDSWTGYGDDSVNEALAKTQTTSDMDEIKGLYSVVDQKVQEDVPMFSAYIVSAQAAVNKRLSNATPSVYGFFNNVEQWEITK